MVTRNPIDAALEPEKLLQRAASYDAYTGNAPRCARISRTELRLRGIPVYPRVPDGATPAKALPSADTARRRYRGRRNVVGVSITNIKPTIQNG